MPKKNKKKTRRKKVSRKVKSRRKKVSRKVKFNDKIIEDKELIFKTRPEWVKNALVNKARYQKNILIL